MGEEDGGVDKRKSNNKRGHENEKVLPIIFGRIAQFDKIIDGFIVKLCENGITIDSQPARFLGVFAGFVAPICAFYVANFYLNVVPVKVWLDTLLESAPVTIVVAVVAFILCIIVFLWFLAHSRPLTGCGAFSRGIRVTLYILLPVQFLFGWLF